MNIAITGAGGVLGKALIRRCTALSDVNVYAFSSRPELLVGANVEALHSSVLDAFDFSQIDCLIWCAFPRGDDCAEIAHALELLARVLRRSVQTGVKRVIHISSQSVYNQKRSEPADEQTPVYPETAYALGKYASELIVNSVCREIPHGNLRMASLLGIDLPQRIVNQLVAQIIAGKKLRVLDGEQRFGYMDVQDAAEGILKMALSDETVWKEVYVFGTDKAYTLREIAETVCLVGEQFGFVAAPPELICDTACKNTSLDCSLFMKQFDWYPKYSLKQTVQRIFAQKLRGIS